MKKLLALTIFAAGYVLGAKAGRQRYEQIRRITMRVKSDPRVQSAAHQAAEMAREQAPVVKDKFEQGAHKVKDKLSHDEPGTTTDTTYGSSYQSTGIR
ncbi:YtxH domain-containing protein [Nocardioides pocheonensis]|jgi:hypothetical protein|uniref:YtxH domain-containing protein n=1 Tax=Nocardioides pocheonensis TaxID=661485 RepID=A0A3N0GP09_9ACTN|nr:YtxH domain-containing protein [Nocardioides pocheonensis]RNM13888.1 YtxH domain-containing protein [Nocardioides pocheonensis]